MTGTIKVNSTGLYTSNQSIVGHQWSQFGVPPSGPMDVISAQMANHLVGNSESENVIEITFSGPKLVFNSPAVVAITGADLSPIVNNKPLTMNQAVLISGGDQLGFGKPQYGVRAYLSVKGGIENDHSYLSKPLLKGQILSINSYTKSIDSFTRVKPPRHLKSVDPISVLKGPEFRLLSSENIDQLFNTSYEIMAESNRMGIRLKGRPISIARADMLTSPVLPGTVQLPPSGIPILLMKDCQTTGGYPRVLQLPEESIAELAQRPWGQEISFKIALDY